MNPRFSMNMDHIVILVTDLEKSLRFYNKLLPMIGFKANDKTVFGNAQGIYFDFRVASEPEHGYHRHGQGLNHIGFTAGSLDEVKQIQQAMEEAGYIMAEIQEFDDGDALFIKDPDGMRIEVSCYKTT